MAAGESIAPARQTPEGATLAGRYLVPPRAELVPPGDLMRNVALRLRLGETQRSMGELCGLQDSTLRMLQRMLRFNRRPLPALEWRDPVVVAIVANGQRLSDHVVYFDERSRDFLCVLRLPQLREFPAVFRAALVHMAVRIAAIPRPGHGATSRRVLSLARASVHRPVRAGERDVQAVAHCGTAPGR